MQDRGLEGSDEMARGMQMQDRRMKPQAEQPQKCPRCDSLNTKFCYYNNYSLSQPRYFCKTCRRYWTKGGTLRNVPVGGGCRKGKRSKRGGSSDDHHPIPIPIPSTFRDQEAIATTSSPGMMVGTVGEDSPVTPPSVYYTGDHGGFSGYNSGPRLQLRMVDQAGSSSAGDNNKLSIFPSLATLQSFNHPTINLVDFSCIFDPRGHHHQLPTSTPTETFQSPSPFNLPVVQGVVNNGPDQWRLQQEHIKFSPVAAAAGHQQQPSLDPHIGRDGPLHLQPVDGNVIQGLKRDQPKLGHQGATSCSSVKHEETTGGSYQDWQVPSHSLIENPTNTDHGETAASGYWNNGCSSGPSPRWPDLSGYGHPPSSFL